MLFNSFNFVLLFLPITLMGYFTLNHYKKYTIGNVWLLAASLFFYGYYDISFIWIIVTSILVNYFAVQLMRHFNGPGKEKTKKCICTLGIVLNVGVLFYFKYFDFLISSFNSLFKTEFSLFYIALPLGISFFTFQQIAYLVDSYRNEIENNNFLDYALFVSFFPKVIQGPIVLHNQLLLQFRDDSRKHLNFENFSRGIAAFTFGLAKKVILADNYGKIVSVAFPFAASLTTFESIIAILGYTLQIYFDFSGYCDMVTGICLMLNIDIPQNFNSPYKATNVVDFWKRWHITLTKFLTKYIYIPLGGNRKGIVRTYINILIVFLISGLWHGAGYTFILWGALHGVGNCIAKVGMPLIKKIPRFVNWLITFIFVNITWVYFRAETVQQGNQLLQSLFNGGFEIRGEITEAFVSATFVRIFNQILPDFMLYILFIAVGILIVTLLKNTYQYISNFRPSVVAWIGIFLLFIYSVLSMSGVSTFLYTNF